ncbi:hypothetical protein C5E45_19095 [Nocardia nova]|uniref:Uncharacterized protein n=1 Tax=Nocardia nova TaxID=37330 RepID=A0A2S6AMR6_9NOCA|nr:hypothetical protein C5E45_19095 [Nocardia nova]
MLRTQRRCDERLEPMPVEEGVAALGKLDGVVANAGICPLGSDDPQAFMDALTVDFNGVVNAIEVALPHVSAGRLIVANGSLAAMMNGTGANPAYGTTGGQGIRWPSGWSHHYQRSRNCCRLQGIRANAVHPTNCNTNILNSEVMYRQFRPDLDHPTLEDALPGFPSMSPSRSSVILATALGYFARSRFRTLLPQCLPFDILGHIDALHRRDRTGMRRFGSEASTFAEL